MGLSRSCSATQFGSMPLIEMQDWDGEMDVVRGEAALNKLTIPVLREQLELRGLAWATRERKVREHVVTG